MDKIPNINDIQGKTQIENFWKYLDDLSSENPEDYKKFISEQIKKGVNQKFEEKEEEKTIIIKPKTFLTLRFKISTILKNIQRKEKDIKISDSFNEDINAVTKILFSFEWQSESFSNKILEEPKVYLNIIYCEEFTPPLDDDNKILKNPEDENKWRYIPTEFRYNNKKNCLSGKRCDFYDMMVNQKVIEVISKNEDFKKSILAYFVKKFSVFLNNKYELYTKNVKILKSKKYKSIKSLPEDFILKLNKANNLDQNPIDQNNITPAKNFFDIPENKINIPNNSENFINTPTFYKLNNQNNKDLNKNNINSLNSKNEKKENISNKILIEDVTKKVKRRIEMKKHILDDKQIEILFQLDIFYEIESLNDINLLISENGIKLMFENIPLTEYEPLDMNFEFMVDPDKCLAKFNKMNKILKVILVRN